MAWDQLWINRPHLAYAIIGGFTTIFSLISLFVKEKLYIGEATVATIVGVIFGPHAAGLFDPSTWGNVDNITLEITRIVLIVQIFAVAVELPKKYMLRHWVSIFYLLVPVMAFGWLLASAFIWKLVPSIRWVEALVVAACVTATDPVLASAVVGKGKFSKRVPGHLRNILSAESGCNDGMAVPFTYLSIYLIEYEGKAGKIIEHWILITILYECIFGCILGALIGYCGRHLIKFAENHNLIDRESFLVFYFVLALFCTGIGSILGTDDLLVAFAAGAAFSWDGWFTRKTEESHVSNVIDLLLNLAYFVYFGAIVPWNLYNSPELGLTPWKLVIMAILLILFRRIPIVLALKPLIPDIRTWREALFCGHFGPIGVGAVFMAILARAELEHGEPTPLAELPHPGEKNYVIVAVIWPIVSFLIVSSIIVHGSSIAVFTLGKRINTMAITMSYTTGNASGPSWLQRLPRVESNQSVSFRKVETTQNDAMSRLFHRRAAGLADSDGEQRPPAAAVGRMERPRRGKKPRRVIGRKEGLTRPDMEDRDTERDKIADTLSEKLGEDLQLSGADFNAGATLPLEVVTSPDEEDIEERINPSRHNVFVEGNNIIVEDEEGEVLTTVDSSSGRASPWIEPAHPNDHVRRRRNRAESDSSHFQPPSHRERAIAYQLDDEVIVENEEGEVIRRYHINRHSSSASHAPGRPGAGLDRALSWVGIHRGAQQQGTPALPGADGIGKNVLPLHSLDLEKQDKDSSASGSSTVTGSGPAGTKRGTGSRPADEEDSAKIDTAELPRNFLQRRTDVDDQPAISRRYHADDDEETPAERSRRLAALSHSRDYEDDDDDDETPAERKRRLAALQGTDARAGSDSDDEDREVQYEGDEDDEEEFEDGNDEDNQEDEDDDDYDYDSEYELENQRDGAKLSPQSSADVPARISFAGETDFDRRRRFAALGLAAPNLGTLATSSGHTTSSESSTSTTPAGTNNPPSRVSLETGREARDDRDRETSDNGPSRGITWGSVVRRR
ncbi:Sodium/hydrogen exchanger family-domain-containing protein [Lipomyces oligophaga]|uniref:Sodium/hydrogen exchanger family-domain-containing protein n=1 Tax=Lipomyces oligophaga TaxID=45792 RepID=UPI0034CFCE37